MNTTKTFTTTKEKSKYGNMNWHVVIETIFGKSSNWFKTKKDAIYFIERMKDASYSKYERNV